MCRPLGKALNSGPLSGQTCRVMVTSETLRRRGWPTAGEMFATVRSSGTTAMVGRCNLIRLQRWAAGGAAQRADLQPWSPWKLWGKITGRSPDFQLRPTFWQ